MLKITLRQKILFFCLVLGFSVQKLVALMVGSDTAVSREQARLVFPADEENEIIGFSYIEGGLLLRDKTVTVTYDAFFSIAGGTVNFAGGTFELEQDLLFTGTNYKVVAGGTFDGQNHAIEFSKQSDAIILPTSTDECGDATFLDQETFFASGRSVDWAPGSGYVAVGTDKAGTGPNVADPEVLVYAFDGTSLSLTASWNFQLNVHEVRWNPNSLHLAACIEENSGSEVHIFRYNPGTNAFGRTDIEELGFDANSCAWHPSGNYLVVGAEGNLFVYSFADGELTVTQTMGSGTPQAPGSTIFGHSISFAPDGKFFAVGSGKTSEQLRVYNFDHFINGIFSSSTAHDIGNQVASLDWSPTGTFIAVGLVSSGERLRIYTYDRSDGSIDAKLQTNVPNTPKAAGVDWHNSGNCLMFVSSAGANADLRLFDFDKTTSLFSLSATSVQEVGNDLYDGRWSQDDGFIGTVGKEEILRVYRADGGGGPAAESVKWLFDQAAVIFNSDVVVRAPFCFSSECRLDLRGSTIFLENQGALIVEPGGHLTIQDGTVVGITSTTLTCSSDSAAMTLRNCHLLLTNDYTFSQGAFTIEDDVVVSGEYIFGYGAKRTSTIDSCAKLIFDAGTTFSYAPTIAKNDLLYFADETAQLCLNGATLHTAATGMLLDGGTLVLDNHVTLSNEGSSSSESLMFGMDMKVNILADATVDAYGQLKML